MPKPPPNFTPYPSRRSDSQPLVPTAPSETVRDWGKYESGRLPDLNLLLDRTLQAIEQSHNYRERSDRSFDDLWEKVCGELKEATNATRFEHLKRARLIKNLNKIKELNDKWNAAWEQLYPREGLTPAQRAKRLQAYEAAERELANEKPRAQVTTDDILEFAIAYWIEAKNAAKAWAVGVDAGRAQERQGDFAGDVDTGRAAERQGDFAEAAATISDEDGDRRCLHALIECWTHIGATMSPKTESEAKSDAGAKQGKDLRDAIANAATAILENIDIKAQMADPAFLWGTVIGQMQADSAQARSLHAYDAHATRGKQVMDTIDDRLVETLMRWTRGDRPAYRHLAYASQRVLAKAEALGLVRKK